MSPSKQASKDTLKKNLTAEHPVADKLKDTLHGSVDTLAEKVGTAEETIRETAQKPWQPNKMSLKRNGIPRQSRNTQPKIQW